MSNRSFLTSACLLLSTAFIIAFIAFGEEPELIERHLINLPMQIDRWDGYEIQENPMVQQILQEDISLYREYIYLDKTQKYHTRYPNDQFSKLTQPVVQLYIGYYGTHKGGRTSHMPTACYPGAGWGIEEFSKEKLVRVRSDMIINKKGSKTLKVNKLIVKKNSQRQIILYWIQTKNNIISSGIMQNVERFKNLILHGRNDGAFVRVSSSIYSQNGHHELQSIKNFAQNLIPLIHQYWPVEKRVSHFSLD